MSVNLNRNFKNELNAFDRKNVVIQTTTGKEFKGVLLGINTDDLSLVLGDATVDGIRHNRIFLSGQIIAEIYMGEAPFDISGLRNELEQIFKKTGVRYFEDTRTIMVMDRYKVSEKGVEGQQGPIMDRIIRIWANYQKEDEAAQEEQAEEEAS